MIQILRHIGLGIVFLWFFTGGIAHFVIEDFFVSITPPWVPFPLFVVYASGVVEIGLALALIKQAYRPYAGWCLIAVTLAVTPANIHMYLNPEQFPDATQDAYLIRLIIQVCLLLLIWWSTRVPKPTSQAG